MALTQDWCVQCGAAAPAASASSGWRPMATILAVTLVLVLGAAAAGYAALSRKTHRPEALTTTVAQAPSTAPSAPLTPGNPTTIKPALPSGRAVKPPKIPLPANPPLPVPTSPGGSNEAGGEEAGGEEAGEGTNAPSPGGNGKGKANGGGERGERGEGGESGGTEAAILLDTNAAATYDPYNYPAADFGDPSLAIDGDTSTGWTAQVQPATAPKMAEGIVIDLKSRHRVAAVKLVTTSRGMTVQVYGANGHAAPSSITDKAWVALSRWQAVRKRHVRIKLRDSSKSFRFVTLWISRAPRSSTPQAPGRVSVNELELLPAK